MIKKSLVILVFLNLWSYYYCFTFEGGTCNRIYFVHPSQRAFPYIQLLNAVYVKTGKVKDGFPVYKDERGDVYFSYDRLKNQFYFSIGSGRFEEFPGLAVESNERQPGVVGKFLYSQNNNQRRVHITLKCVDSVTDCINNNLIVTYNDAINGKLSRFMFTSSDDVIINNRRVYIENKSKVKLYYNSSGNWNIGNDISLMKSTIFSVKSNAIKPEFITENWQRKTTSGSWISTNVSVECKGSEIIQCSSKPCQNFGTCHNNSIGQSFCTCPYNFYGRFCQRTTHHQCKSPGDQTNVNNNLGSVRNEFCPTNSILPFKTLVCRTRKNGKLAWEGTACSSVPSVGKFRSNNWRYWNGNKEETIDDKWLSIALRVLVIFIPVFLLPILHSCIHECCKNDLPSIVRTYSKHAYIGVFIWLIFIIVYQHGDISKHGPETFKFIFIVAVVFTVLGYLFVLVESFCANDRKYLESAQGGAVGKTYIKSMFAKPPTITIHMSCYHMETRTRQVSYRDRDGNLQHRTESYQEEIQTWRGEEKFQFNFWKDKSDAENIPKVDATNPILRIRLKNRVIFADKATESAFNAQMETFINTNKHRDRQYHSHVAKNVSGLKKHVMIYDEEQGLPPWLNEGTYVMCVIFLCSWPYRILMKRTTKKGQFEICKSVSNTPFRTPQLSSPRVTDNNSTQEATAPAIVNEDIHLIIDDAPPPYEEAVNLAKPPKYGGLYDNTEL